MKILKIYPAKDNPKRRNYEINYGVWDCIEGDKVILERFNVDPNEYDVIFFPMFKRWERRKNLFNRLMQCKAKKILFDNDSCYRTFDHPFYKGFDFIFYRDTDMDNNIPNCTSALFKWSVDTNKFLPTYNKTNISFNCSVHKKAYPLRYEINKFFKRTKLKGDAYIKHLQSCGAGLHIDSHIVNQIRAKALEYASCGCEIISNRTKNMNLYYPDKLITYFDNLVELQEIIKNYKPNGEIQKQLREITVEKHDNKIRAKEILNNIYSL